MWISLRPWAVLALVLSAACATSGAPTEGARAPGEPPTKPTEDESTAAKPVGATPDVAPAPAVADKSAHGGIVAADAAPSDAFGDVGMKELTEKNWQAGLRKKIATQENIEPALVLLSPGRLRAAFVRSPPPVAPKPGHHAQPRRHQIVVVDNEGQRVASFRPVTRPGSDEPPKDLAFLAEDRLVYEVAEPAPPPELPAPKRAAAKSKRKGHVSVAHRGAKAAPLAKPSAAEPPPRLFVIQPIEPRARPIRCEGFHFAFSREHDRLAFVGGKAESAFVAVDGEQVFPRRGRTIVASAPVWSKDGRSLAFLESPAAKPIRLVLLAQFDNATGDTTWDLPPTAPVDGVGVFWAGSSKLVVGKTSMHPVFSAAFEKDAPPR